MLTSCMIRLLLAAEQTMSRLRLQVSIEERPGDKKKKKKKEKKKRRKKV